MKCFARLTVCAIMLCLAAVDEASADDARLRGMRLLPGYTHVPKQGFDSLVGEINKEGGLSIRYEIGRVAKPGGPAMGGDFRDHAKLTPKEKLQWYREQTVGDQPVHLAYRKDKVLLASFPKTGMNLHTTIKSTEDFADAMLMILTYPQPAAADPAPKREAGGGEKSAGVWIKTDGKWAPAKLPIPALAGGKAVEVKVVGTLTHGIMAIGGETTGTIIRFEKTAWELDLRKDRAFRLAADKLNGKQVVVTGAVRVKAGVEIAKRTILTVDSLDVAK